MRSRASIVAIASSLVVLVAFFALLPTPTNKEVIFNKNFAITNVRIFDGDNTIENGTLEVRDNRIVTITVDSSPDPTPPVLDGSGHTLLPGLVDAHTHTWGDAPTQALNFGVSTMLDMFTTPDFMRAHIAARDKASNHYQADVFSAMYLATAPKGHGTQFGILVPVLQHENEVERFVSERIAEGGTYIKAVYFSPQSPNTFFPSISLSILKKLANEARANNLKLLVHVDDLISAKEAITAGAHGLVHIFTDKLADQAIVDLMLEQNVFVVPTLTVIAKAAGVACNIDLLGETEISQHLWPQQIDELRSGFNSNYFSPAHYKRALQSVKRLHDAGVPILVGSDAPNPGTTHGASIHEEMRHLVEAGLTPKEVLRAATGTAHTLLPIKARGTLAVNGDATMVLVEGNPLADIEHTAAIRKIWKQGQFVERFQAQVKPSSEASKVERFAYTFTHSESDLAKRFVVTTDAIMQGKSSAEIRFELDNASGHMAFDGELRQGAMFPWTGVALSLSTQKEGVFDLTDTTILSFTARSDTAKELTVLLMQEGVNQPFTQTIMLTEQWQTHRLDLSEMANIDLSKIVALALVFMGPPGTYNLDLDAIELGK